MKIDDPLKIQAYLDGELSAREAREFRERLGEDLPARELLEELTAASGWLREENAPTRQVPESRNAYWHGIRRRIESQPAPTPVEAWLALCGQWLSRYRLPAAGFAAGLLLAVMVVGTRNGTPEPSIPSYVERVEPLPGLTTMSYFNPTEEIAVVWISAEGNSDLP